MGKPVVIYRSHPGQDDNEQKILKNQEKTS